VLVENNGPQLLLPSSGIPPLLGRVSVCVAWDSLGQGREAGRQVNAGETAQQFFALNPPQAMLCIKQLPTFDSTASGVKNVVDLPQGLRYHVIWLGAGQ